MMTVVPPASSRLPPSLPKPPRQISYVGYEHVDHDTVSDAIAGQTLFIHGSRVDEGSGASIKATTAARKEKKKLLPPTTDGKKAAKAERRQRSLKQADGKHGREQQQRRRRRKAAAMAAAAAGTGESASERGRCTCFCLDQVCSKGCHFLSLWLVVVFHFY